MKVLYLICIVTPWTLQVISTEINTVKKNNFATTAVAFFQCTLSRPTHVLLSCPLPPLSSGNIIISSLPHHPLREPARARARSSLSPPQLHIFFIKQSWCIFSVANRPLFIIFTYDVCNSLITTQFGRRKKEKLFLDEEIDSSPGEMK